MSSSTHQIKVKGVDQTGAAFASIGSRAKAAAGQIRGIMGGAIAAAGAFLSVRAVSQTVGELGSLSDQAMKAGTSVEFLTQAATAFQVAGLNISVDQLTKSFQYLEKTTGKKGEGAFWEAVQSIAAIEDPAKRGAEIVKTFGRSGLELQPLINGGADAVDKFQKLMHIMPGVSTAAAQAGDAVADAQTILGAGIHNLWANIIGKLCSLWGEDFPGGVRAGALNAVNWVETFAKKAYAVIANWGTKVMASFAWIGDLFTGGWDQANAVFAGTVNAADAEYEARMKAANEAREKYVAELKELNVDDLAGAFDGRKHTIAQDVGDAVGESAAKAAQRISNQLIMGGSNSAQRLSMLGPEYQNEARKQTAELKEINKTLQEIRDMDSDVQLATTDLGV